MTDRELLEMAAKAFKTDFLLMGDWDPLGDDGTAFRLMVALSLCVEFEYCSDNAPIVRCGHPEDRENWTNFACFSNRAKTVRLAIVHAAAEIGKAMPQGDKPC